MSFLFYINYNSVIAVCGSEITKEILQSKVLTDQTMMCTIKLFLKNSNNLIEANVMFHKLDVDPVNYVTEIKILNKDKFKIKNNEASALFQHILMTICLKNPNELVSLYVAHHKAITGDDLTSIQLKQIYNVINNVVASFILTKSQFYEIILTEGELLKSKNFRIGTTLLNSKITDQYASSMLQVWQPSQFVEVIANYNDPIGAKKITQDYKGLNIFIEELSKSLLIEKAYFSTISDLLTLTAPEFGLKRLNSVTDTEILSAEFIINSNYSFNDVSGITWYKDLIYKGNSSFTVAESMIYSETLNDTTKEIFQKKNPYYLSSFKSSIETVKQTKK